jgi:hypothetical protein
MSDHLLSIREEARRVIAARKIVAHIVLDLPDRTLRIGTGGADVHVGTKPE